VSLWRAGQQQNIVDLQCLVQRLWSYLLSSLLSHSKLLISREIDWTSLPGDREEKLQPSLQKALQAPRTSKPLLGNRKTAKPFHRSQVLATLAEVREQPQL